jgi:uncharacterized iron-regulated membrane protein
MQMRTVHRVLAIVVVLFTLYLGVTGSLIELVDFTSLLSRASPFDANVEAMNEDFAGPPNFRVLGVADNVAQALPDDRTLDPLMRRVVAASDAQFGKPALRFVELRMAGGRPVGQVRVGTLDWRYDAETGRPLGLAPPVENENMPPASLRNTVKHLHRMTTFGNWALWINIFVSLSLAVLIVTGITIYWRVLKARRRMKRTNPFWMAGGTWRALHRSTSIVAAIFLTVITLSGSWLAFESLWFGLYLDRHPGVILNDASSPLDEAALSARLQTSLSAYRRMNPRLPIRVIRLRNYGKLSQGVFIGGGARAEQIVFDSVTGNRDRLTEPGYPPTGFPFGWQAHQWAKSVHRGDFFGLTGRMTSLLAGFAMIYLSISGIVVYLSMWSKRRKAGRRTFIWK